VTGLLAGPHGFRSTRNEALGFRPIHKQKPAVGRMLHENLRFDARLRAWLHLRCGINGVVGVCGWGSTVPGQNEHQTSEADLDRKIIDLGHAITLNPKNAKAYHDRALLYVRKRDFGHALNDLDRAILLNPKNAHSYYFRGQIFLRVNKENAKAAADFDKAIELDPLMPIIANRKKRPRTRACLRANGRATPILRSPRPSTKRFTRRAWRDFSSD
jgi:tetratricopeptide (TPR) repeat protein